MRVGNIQPFVPDAIASALGDAEIYLPPELYRRLLADLADMETYYAED